MASVKYELLKQDGDYSKIEIEVDSHTLIDLFSAGTRYGIDELAKKLKQ